MKPFLSLIVIVYALLASCTLPYFYQVYKTTPSQNLNILDNHLVYEDENCLIYYNLWKTGGDIGFQFFNKTSSTLFLHLDECYFILNGISYDYYKNRVYNYSTSTGVATTKGLRAAKAVTGINNLGYIQTNSIAASGTSGISSNTGYSVSYGEEKILNVPANASKIISEYTISKVPFRHCDLYKYPSEKQMVNSAKFTKEDSPLKFTNRITYSFGDGIDFINVTNEFYVSEISNLPERAAVRSHYIEYCGTRKPPKIKSFKINSPKDFYIKYDSNQISWIKL
jgi:hypothetical protein